MYIKDCVHLRCITSGGSRIYRWGGGGGADLRRVHFLAKMYVKTKEMDPAGGGRVPAAPPGSANDNCDYIKLNKLSSADFT